MYIHLTIIAPRHSICSHLLTITCTYNCSVRTSSSNLPFTCSCVSYIILFHLTVRQNPRQYFSPQNFHDNKNHNWNGGLFLSCEKKYASEGYALAINLEKWWMTISLIRYWKDARLINVNHGNVDHHPQKRTHSTSFTIINLKFFFH